MGHKVKNYSANHRGEIPAAGQNGQKESSGRGGLLLLGTSNGTLIYYD